MSPRTVFLARLFGIGVGRGAAYAGFRAQPILPSGTPAHWDVRNGSTG